MLLDDFDQQGSKSKVFDSGGSHHSDQGNSLTPSRFPERTRFALSDSSENILQSQDDAQHPSDFATRATSVVHAAGDPDNASNNTSAEAMQSRPDTAERLEGSPVRLRHEHSDISGTYALGCATSYSHENLEDNDDTWLRFIQEEKLEVGHAKSDRFAAPQFEKQASPNALPTLTVVQDEPQDEPQYAVSLRDSTPHSSCPTARACLLETGTFKRIGGETSEKGPRLGNDDQVWRRFVLGYDPAEAS